LTDSELISEEKWLGRLEIFLGKISTYNMEVVKNKFQPNLSYEQKWDLLHELIIAAFFHKAENIKFMDDSSQSHCELLNMKKSVKLNL